MSHDAMFGRSRRIRSFMSTDLKTISKFQYEMLPWARQRVINKILTHSCKRSRSIRASEINAGEKSVPTQQKKKKSFGQRNPPNLIQFHPTASSELNFYTDLFSHLGSVCSAHLRLPEQHPNAPPRKWTPNSQETIWKSVNICTFVSWMQHV